MRITSSTRTGAPTTFAGGGRWPTGTKRRGASSNPTRETLPNDSPSIRHRSQVRDRRISERFRIQHPRGAHAFAARGGRGAEHYAAGGAGDVHGSCYRK